MFHVRLGSISFKNKYRDYLADLAHLSAIKMHLINMIGEGVVFLYEINL